MNNAQLLNEAGTALSEMDAHLAAATERMAVKDYASSQKEISAAHTLLGTAGAALGRVADAVLAPVISKPVTEVPIATAGNFDPNVQPTPPDNSVYVDTSGWTDENWQWFLFDAPAPLWRYVEAGPRTNQMKNLYSAGGDKYNPARAKVKPANFVF